MKQVTLGAGIVLAAVIAVLALTKPIQHDIRTITVDGHAHRKLVPDEAHLRVNLNSINMQMDAAKADHDEKLKKLLAITKDEGVEERKIRTDSSSVQPVYEFVNEPSTTPIPNPQPKRVFRGYRVQTMLDITVVDTAKVGALMEKITNAGFEQNAKTEWGNLLELNYQVSEPEQKRDALIAEAIAAARTKAENMAKAAGTSIAGVQQITEGNASSPMPTPMPMLAMAKSSMAGDGAAPVTPPSGEQNLEANVSVIFELN